MPQQSNKPPRSNKPLTSKQRSAPKGASVGRAARTQPKKQKRTKRSDQHGTSVVKSGSSAKPRSGSTTHPISLWQILRAVAALEKQYGGSAEKRAVLDELVRRPTQEGIDLIVAYDWPDIKAEVGRTFNPHLLIQLAVKEKGRLNREAARRAKDARKASRPDKSEPYRRAPRTKSSLQRG
jgi:hypothetical protein